MPRARKRSNSAPSEPKPKGPHDFLFEMIEVIASDFAGFVSHDQIDPILQFAIQIKE
jgi:hypothetical protein